MKHERTAKNHLGAKRPLDTKDPCAQIETETCRTHSHFRIKKILAPVDFSKSSTKALQYAVAAARDFGADLIVLHVVQPYPVLPDLPAATVGLTQVLEKDAKEKLARLAETITGVNCERVVGVGHPARVITAEARERNVDLIVISTHGRTGLPHLLIGSVAENVVRLAHCPVLTIHEQGRDVVEIPPDDRELNQVGQAANPRRRKSDRKLQSARSS